MKKIVFFVSLIYCIPSFGQTNWENGKVLDSIAVGTNAEESFALYLPTDFTEERLSPIVFIFEPAARGKIGIAPFILAAEKYGYILVCSNTTRNGPYNRNFDIAGRLFDYIFAHFNIDPAHVFLSGFSGGSRLAATIATLSDGITGVIACGAGLSTHPSHMPYGKKFIYAGICGDRDMNYTEMIEVMPFLERLKIPKTLFTFEGEHRWPPEEEILKVFDWMQVKLDQKGQGKIDAEQLLALYRNGYSDALEELNKNNFIVAVEGLERLQESYPKELTKDSITAKLKAIKSSKGYKAQVVSASKAYEKEKVLTIKYQQKISTDLQNPDKAKLLYWEKEIEKLGKLKDKGDLEMQKMVDRLTFKVFANFYSSTNLNTNASEEQKAYAQKVIAVVRQSSEH